MQQEPTVGSHYEWRVAMMKAFEEQEARLKVLQRVRAQREMLVGVAGACTGTLMTFFLMKLQG